MAWAAIWSGHANIHENTVTTVCYDTNGPRIHGPHLAGALGDSQSLLDFAVSPDGRFALVSDVHAQAIYRLDLTNPAEPTLAASLTTTFMPLDIAISPDGRWAVVTGGATTQELNFIDLVNNTIAAYTLTTADGYGQAVAIAPDGTVIVTDVANDRLIYGPVNAARNGLSSELTISAGDAPVNVETGEDGLVLVVSALSNEVRSYTLSGGLLNFVNAVTVMRPAAVAITPKGRSAYVISREDTPDQLLEMTIAGGNLISLSGRTATLLTDAPAIYFGVDPLAVSPDGRFVLAANPDDINASRHLAQVHIETFTTTTIPVDTAYPIGIGIFTSNIGCASTPSPVPTIADWGYGLLILSLLALVAFRLGRHPA
ncbi:MAG: hypothetical protein EOM24_15445 [Chloroflexia bacterium]|nr:hypothetical protein [Chloroflexia bacterium]